MKLKDKIVLISEGDSALGLEIAKVCKEEGAILAEHHVNPVSKAEVDGAVDKILAAYGRIDVFIHNNNRLIPSLLEDCDDDSYDEALDYNLKSAFLFVQALGSSMKRAGRGNIIFISSIHDEKPSGAAFSYSLAKGALKLLAKELVLDLGPHGVRTNIINAGPMEGDGERFKSSLSPLYEFTRERIPDLSYVAPEDIARGALFFAGDDCPSANGASLTLDRGFLLSYFVKRRPPRTAP
ncbi:MAG: SDR family oxidoreductase [Treponema sp.]|nr:SDR family oxidoreductase [Treponema sp.]